MLQLITTFCSNKTETGLDDIFLAKTGSFFHFTGNTKTYRVSTSYRSDTGYLCSIYEEQNKYIKDEKPLYQLRKKTRVEVRENLLIQLKELGFKENLSILNELDDFTFKNDFENCSLKETKKEEEDFIKFTYSSAHLSSDSIGWDNIVLKLPIGTKVKLGQNIGKLIGIKTTKQGTYYPTYRYIFNIITEKGEKKEIDAKTIGVYLKSKKSFPDSYYHVTPEQIKKIVEVI